MKILLSGATDFIGSYLKAALEEQEHVITACSRRTGVDYSQMQTSVAWQRYVEGIDVVINAVGIIAESKGQSFEALHKRAPTALFQACKQAQVGQVIQISALGVDESAFTPYQLSSRP